MLSTDNQQTRQHLQKHNPYGWGNAHILTQVVWESYYINDNLELIILSYNNGKEYSRYLSINLNIWYALIIQFNFSWKK